MLKHPHIVFLSALSLFFIIAGCSKTDGGEEGRNVLSRTKIRFGTEGHLKSMVKPIDLDSLKLSGFYVSCFDNNTGGLFFSNQLANFKNPYFEIEECYWPNDDTLDFIASSRELSYKTGQGFVWDLLEFPTGDNDFVVSKSSGQTLEMTGGIVPLTFNHELSRLVGIYVRSSEETPGLKIFVEKINVRNLITAGALKISIQNDSNDVWTLNTSEQYIRTFTKVVKDSLLVTSDYKCALDTSYFFIPQPVDIVLSCRIFNWGIENGEREFILKEPVASEIGKEYEFYVTVQPDSCICDIKTVGITMAPWSEKRNDDITFDDDVVM